MLASCVHGSGEGGDDEDSDSIDVDTMAMEELDLFEPMVIPESADELFDDFFYSFLEDEGFRQKRINVELENQSILMKEAYVVVYERDEDLEMRKDTTVSSVALEWISWGNEDVDHYNFERGADGHWMLNSIEPESIAQLPNGQFFEFLRQFFTDEEFRLSAIDFPLTFIISPQEGDEGGETLLDDEGWAELYNQLPDLSSSIVCIDYGQMTISQNRKTLLLEGLSSGLEMKLMFDHSGGEWKLIKIES